MPFFTPWKKPKPPTRKPQTYRFSTVINEARPSRTNGYLTLAPFTPAPAAAPQGAGAGVRLRGLWLQDAGFKIGDEIKVHVEPGKLTITLRD
jgi:hypothetical protein